MRLPTGDEMTVFSQNLGVGRAYTPGEQVVMAWDARHGFGLSGSEDRHSGVELADEPVG